MAAPRESPTRSGYVPLSRRKESYDSELHALEATYANARLGSPALHEVLESLLWIPTWYVGNGGTMAVAQYAAELHNQQTGLPAIATTSLGFATSQVATGSAVVIISASAKHPDTAATVRTALERKLSRVVVVTERDRSQLTGAFASAQVEVVTLSRPGPGDGFLATNSVLNMSTAFAAAYSSRLPKTLPGFTSKFPGAIRPGDDLLLLSSAGTWAAATDLETRLVETGLATVQKTDFRNFAHGRHLGLSRMAGHVSVIAMSDSRTARLATATLDLLPADIPVIHLTSAAPAPASSLDLLVRSMRLTGSISNDSGFDPARPQVPSFGRRLYRLESRRHLPGGFARPDVVAKLEAACLPVGEPTLRDFSRRRTQWLRKTVSIPIAGILVDYDGTVCTTAGRFDPPSGDLQEAFVRLLHQGLAVGFVSGRGKSLPQSLRQWVPTDLRSRVAIGLYNGAVRGTLDEMQALRSGESGPFTETAPARRAMRDLQGLATRFGGVLDARPFQVSLEAGTGKSAHWPALARAVEELVARENLDGRIRLKAVRSAHSIDIIPASSTKNLLRSNLEAIQTKSGATLAIGDRGGLGGNDYELLAFDSLTLSVDQVSGDPSRCWNLAVHGPSGPDLLSRYLTAVKPDRQRVHTFRWTDG